MTFIECAYTGHLLWEDEVVIVKGRTYCEEHAKHARLYGWSEKQ